MDGIDFNLTDYLKFIFAFVFVLALMALATVAARRFGFGMQTSPRKAAQRRLGIVESLNVDGKRRMVLVRRDDIEHLLLLGTGTELLIESHISPPENAFTKALNDAARATAESSEKQTSPQGPPLPKALTPDGNNDRTEKKP